MTRVLRILAALAVLAALLGAESSGCEPPERNHTPRPRTTVKRTVEIRANSHQKPYSLLLVVKDPDTGALKLRVGPELVAGGEYTKQVEYDSGEVLGIYVVVWGNPADTMECSITDGPKVDRPKPKAKEVMCVLLTSR